LSRQGKYGGILEQADSNVRGSILLLISIPGRLMGEFSQVSPKHFVDLFNLVRHICL